MEEQPESKQKLFGAKEILALIAALGISVLILLFHRQVAALQSLGYLGAFLIMLISSATLILPTPGLFLVAALAGTGLNPVLLGVVSGLGSGLGEVTGYLAGYSGNRMIAHTKIYKRIEKNVEQRGFWTILILAVIPNPIFDLAGIAAGALKMRLDKFLLATIIGKVIKMLAFAYAGSMSAGWLTHWF